jgi:hypothetical protein
MPPPEDRAELLRKDLRSIGIARPVLFIEGDPVEQALTFHDLRDTGLTHTAVRGDSPILIQWVAAHRDYEITQGYVDRGKVEARAELVSSFRPFQRSSSAIPRRRRKISPRDRPRSISRSVSTGNPWLPAFVARVRKSQGFRAEWESSRVPLRPREST